MADLLVATEMPSGARSRGYSRRRNPVTKTYENFSEELATEWFGKILDQMKVFNIVGSAVVMLGGETEVMRENIP